MCVANSPSEQEVLLSAQLGIKAAALSLVVKFLLEMCVCGSFSGEVCV